MFMPIMTTSLIYYGKCPAHGDFLKTRGQSALIHLLDQWISAALEYAMQSADFATHYKQLPRLDFFIANPQDNSFLVANLISSEDSSGRHFPMLLSHFLEVDLLSDNILYALLRYKQTLNDLFQKNKEIYALDESDLLLDKLEKLGNEIDVLTYNESAKFYHDHTLHSFSQLMNLSANEMVQSMIGLGLLLQPVIQQGTEQIKKVLLLPINNSSYSHEIAAFWVNLISYFVAKQNAELWIGILHLKQPVLLCGFQGADIIALSEIFNQKMDSRHWVSLLQANWIDPYLEHNAGLAVLEQVLSERQLSLTQGMKLFKQTFINE